MIRTHPLLASVLLLGFAMFVFWRVRIDYRNRGKLTLVSAILQFLVIFFHGVASYSFLDNTGPAGPRLRVLALGIMMVGLAGALVGMAQLSLGDTFGRSVKGLRNEGFYRFSKNPQLVFYLVILVGYVLLQPAWEGLAWLSLYLAIAHVMVLSEEEHLRRVFVQEYEDYCRKTYRYLGFPRRGLAGQGGVSENSTL
jgi:protein-S-isoprenylcysteine O-methyltransferase Ste14